MLNKVKIIQHQGNQIARNKLNNKYYNYPILNQDKV